MIIAGRRQVVCIWWDCSEQRGELREGPRGRCAALSDLYGPPPRTVLRQLGGEPSRARSCFAESALPFASPESAPARKWRWFPKQDHHGPGCQKVRYGFLLRHPFGCCAVRVSLQMLPAICLCSNCWLSIWLSFKRSHTLGKSPPQKKGDPRVRLSFKRAVLWVRLAFKRCCSVDAVLPLEVPYGGNGCASVLALLCVRVSLQAMPYCK